MFEEIQNHELIFEKIPDPDADWSQIARFALTMNGYKKAGSFEKCAEIATAGNPKTLTELRLCLFFEQRTWHHFAEVPDSEDMTYIRDLVKRIKEKVQSNELE
jgi:hypothetical protein